MEKALADFSIHWENVGPFHDFSKVLRQEDYDDAETCGEESITGVSRKITSLEAYSHDIDPIYERVREEDLIAKLGRLHSRWDAIIFDLERRLDHIHAMHEECIHNVDELTHKQSTYCLNFKHVNQKFNILSERKATIGEKLGMLEEMHNHYSQYKGFARTLHQIENNEFIRTKTTSDPTATATDDEEQLLTRTLDYGNKIADRLNTMLPAIDASIDFFSIHTDYFNAESTRYQYEALRTSIFGVIKMVFKEFYNFANDISKDVKHFDVAEHYNKYRRIGRSVRNLSKYYTLQVTEVCTAEFLQLQMYYITNRIKMLNPLMMHKMESFKDFESIASFFLIICNLEILTFKETFVSDATNESLGTMVENVVFYFTEACKQHIAKLQTSADMRAALSSLKNNLINPISKSNNEDVLSPLMLKAQKFYQTVEMLLLKNVHRDVMENIRRYDRKPYVDSLCNNKELELDWDNELLTSVKDNLKGGMVYPPVCFGIAIVNVNKEYLGEPHINGLVTTVIHAIKTSLINVQYDFKKRQPLNKELTKINEELIVMSNIQHVLEQLADFKESQAYRAIESLYAEAERHFCSGVTNIILKDFIDFTKKQSKHDDGLYQEMLTKMKSQLSEKMPLIKLHLNSILLEPHYTDTCKQLMESLKDVPEMYMKKFGLEKPDIDYDYETSTLDVEKNMLLNI